MFFTYLSMTWRSDCEATKLETIIIPIFSGRMKLTVTLDLTFLSALLMLAICSFAVTKMLSMLSLFIETITCFVKIVDGGLYFIFSFHFILFLFFFYILFSIFRTTRVRDYQTHCHISHKLMAKSQDWSWDLGEWSKRFWNEVISFNMDNTCWPHVIHMVI